MADRSLPVHLQLGFLLIVPEGTGWLGGLLVTNNWGRPLEFRLSTAVQPTRVQEILYGPSLKEYVTHDLIAKTLIEKSATSVHWLVVETAELLSLQSRHPFPVTQLQPLSETPTENTIIHRVGRSSLGVTLHPDVQEAYAEMLTGMIAQVDMGLDIAEPFTRIREAMQEARRMGGAKPVSSQATAGAYPPGTATAA